MIARHDSCETYRSSSAPQILCVNHIAFPFIVPYLNHRRTRLKLSIRGHLIDRCRHPKLFQDNFRRFHTASPLPAAQQFAKSYPEWPTDAEWSMFNYTLGVSIKEFPASVCYEPNYNATRYAFVASSNYRSQSRSNDPVEIVNK